MCIRAQGLRRTLYRAAAFSAAVLELLTVGQDEAQVAMLEGQPGKAIKQCDAQAVEEADFGGGGARRPGWPGPKQSRRCDPRPQAVFVEPITAPGACVVDAAHALQPRRAHDADCLCESLVARNGVVLWRKNKCVDTRH